MIVDEQFIKNLPGRVCLVAGGFDPIHQGHLLYFKKAKENNLPVVVSVDPDSYVEKKHKILLHQEERSRVLNEFRDIDFVYINKGTTAEALEMIKPAIFVKDLEWKEKLPEIESEICRRNNTTIQWVDTRLGSSSELIRKLKGDLSEELKSFERFVQEQKTPDPSSYDETYFQADWRGTDNEYTLESRRKIEDQHPRILKQTFSPIKALDVGCGPGFLMKFLFELGVDVWGVDASSDVIAIAPDDVKDRIKVGSITRLPSGDNEFDLVICREVMEHLSVLDIFRSVLEICRVSSKYVYVTTRFHPNPQSLFEVTDEKSVDPTHISLLNINLLRLMFVLAGFERDFEKERSLDWKNKGRVLVYRKPQKGG